MALRPSVKNLESITERTFTNFMNFAPKYHKNERAQYKKFIELLKIVNKN